MTTVKYNPTTKKLIFPNTDSTSLNPLAYKRSIRRGTNNLSRNQNGGSNANGLVDAATGNTFLDAITGNGLEIA